MTIREETFCGMPVSCQVIDAHTHLGPDHAGGWHQKYSRTATDSVLEDLGRLGIDCIVTAPHTLTQKRMQETNLITKEAAAKYPGKVYGYIAVIPWHGLDEVKRELESYRNDPAFLGIKLLTGIQGSLLQPEYLYALDFAEEMGCPVLCHEYANIPDRQEFVTALKKRHRMKLLIAHQGGGFATDTRACAPIIRDYENAFMELCGSVDNQLTVAQIVDLVGEDKVIFGTDAINLDPKYEIGKVAFSPICDDVKKKIFAQNYLGLLGDSQMGQITVKSDQECRFEII